jgi:pimeloyl-ACP methyl ester carboxylesterase
MSGTIAPRLHASLVAGMTAGRYLDRYYRDGFDRAVRPPLIWLVQALIRRRLPPQPTGPAEERELEGEAAATQEIIDTMATFARRAYAHATSERVGNTKTYGVVRGDFVVLDGIPERLRHGVFAQAQTFPAWVRFGGPGPLAPPDPRDNGILSVGIKLMDVPGPKLLDDERHTQDFTGISSPTFTTPDLVENVKLQRRLLQGLPAFYFVDPRDLHLLDAIMQGLYARMNTNPLEVSYWSCVPYLLGEGQAMRYAIHPRASERTRIPVRPPANYLRQAMARTLAARPVEFDFKLQLQTDPRRMPIENASVLWSERRAPPVTVGRLRLPVQEFDTPEQHAFARTLSYQPWHSIEEHRPLGNQNRARRRIYYELSKLRQEMNGDARVEPDGSERFPPRAARAPVERRHAQIEHLQVEANGITFHVAVSGPETAPPIVCLHGFPEGWMVWRPVMERLPEARVYAPDLRGYPGSERPPDGYDVFTLTEDVKGLIETLGLDRPLLVGDDWGGELGWIFAHRYSHLIRGLVAINGPHPRTLERAVFRLEDFQTFRIPWVPFFQIPRLPEWLATTRLGRRLLLLSITLREGRRGEMDRALVEELIARFREPPDFAAPVEYYREIVRSVLSRKRRAQLHAVYETPITAPTTLVWGMKDEALSSKVARKSGRDAGVEVDWRPLPDVGHFVGLEAPDDLVAEIDRALAATGDGRAPGGPPAG